MIADQRLRLLGGQSANPDESRGRAALDLLDSTTIRIRIDSDAPAARLGAAALAVLAARLFPRVEVDDVELPMNWWGAQDTRELLTSLSPVRPVTALAAAKTITLGIGTTDGCDLYVGGGDWTCRFGTSPVVLDSTITHGVGVQAAACFSIGQVLGRVLKPVGFHGVQVGPLAEMNLVDYRLTSAPSAAGSVGEHLKVLVAGIGSVGSSTIAALASAILLNPDPGLRVRLAITCVDDDPIDPTRNPYRYPALNGHERGPKSAWVTERLKTLGFVATPETMTVGAWTAAQPQPGWDGLLVSSVDTIPGRLDVADVLARETLSLGVKGLALHAQRERFGDGYACAYCDFVTVGLPTTQAGEYAQLTGILVPRILELLQPGCLLQEADVDMAVNSRKIAPERRDALVGSPLTDLVRQVYAEAPVGGAQGEPEFAIAAPHVSWLAGVIGAAEILKQCLRLDPVERRTDVDLSGLPAGLVTISPAEASGRCVCHSGTRRDWYARLYA